MKIIWFLFMSFPLILSACGTASPVPTLVIALPSETESTIILPTETLSPVPSPSPTSTPAAMIMPPDFSPILYGKKYDANTFFVLLGGVQGDEWLDPDLAFARFAGAWEYDVYTFAKGSFQVHGNAPEFSPPGHGYFVETDVTIDEFGMVGVAQGWHVLQGAVDEFSPGNQFYEQVVIDWLMAEGISDPQLNVLRVFRVDIEGDGVDEIFINAIHLDESQHTTKSGDYSIILMRRVVGNDAVTLPIVGDVYHSQELEITFPRTYSLGNFIDLNQDGVLEVVVDIQRWEGFGAIVYQIDGQEILQSLRAE